MVEQIRVKLPDGNETSHRFGITVKEILAGWNKAKLASTVAAKVNGVPVDLGHIPTGDAVIELIDSASPEGLSILRHSMAHVMAQAVQDSFPGVQVSIGPSIEDGFYYDFEYGREFHAAGSRSNRVPDEGDRRRGLSF